MSNNNKDLGLQAGDVLCVRCGLINDYRIVQAGPHDKAVCNGCDNYIKFLPKKLGRELTGDSIIHFGKYKGRQLKEVPNDYLFWCYDNLNLNQRLKAYIESQKK